MAKGTITLSGSTVGTKMESLEVEQGATGGVNGALKVDNNDTDKQAFAIEAANIDANVMQITADALTTSQAINITADGLTTGSALRIDSDSSSTGTRSIANIIQNHASASGSTVLRLQQDGTGDIVNFFDGGTERFTILDGGNVGINTTAPAAALTVIGTMNVGVNDTGHDVTFFGAAAGAAMIWDEDANSLLVRGATADAVGSTGRIVLQTAQVAVADGDILGRLDFQAPLETQGSDGALVTASIWAEGDATFSATVNGTDLVFATANGDAVVERMRLDKDGKVGIGTSAPASLLDVQGTVQVGVDNTGHDVKFFGATTGRFMHWDESADELLVHGKISQRFGSAFKNQTHAGWVMGG